MTTPLGSNEARQSSRERLMRSGAILYAVGLFIHSADHVRRGIDAITPQVKLLGALSTTVGVITIVLVLNRHRWASLAAAVIGLQVALGTAAVHLLPRWSTFSDAFPGSQGTGVTPLSYFVVLVEIAGALLLGIAGTTLYLASRADAQPSGSFQAR